MSTHNFVWSTVTTCTHTLIAMNKYFLSEVNMLLPFINALQRNLNTWSGEEWRHMNNNIINLIIYIMFNHIKQNYTSYITNLRVGLIIVITDMTKTIDMLLFIWCHYSTPCSIQLLSDIFNMCGYKQQ